MRSSLPKREVLSRLDNFIIAGISWTLTASHMGAQEKYHLLGDRYLSPLKGGRQTTSLGHSLNKLAQFACGDGKGSHPTCTGDIHAYANPV